MSGPSKRIERLRSLLFAPAVRPDFIEKLPERGADGVVIDCEDATPPNATCFGVSPRQAYHAAEAGSKLYASAASGLQDSDWLYASGASVGGVSPRGSRCIAWGGGAVVA